MSKSKGLGDTIKKVAGTVGIKKCSKCEKRRRFLNKKLPYQQP